LGWGSEQGHSMLRHTPYSESETWPLTLVIDIVIKIDEKRISSLVKQWYMF
jgi:hypothetical protein